MRTETVTSPGTCCCGDDCGGWYCCPVTGEVAYAANCEELAALGLCEQSSSASVPSVSGPCCGGNIPANLFLSIFDCPGNVLDGMTVPLVLGLFPSNPDDWGADFGVTSPDCVSETNGYRTLFGCFPISGEFYFETYPGYCGFGGGTIEVQTCSPFFMSGTGAINQGFSAPTCSWEISE